MAQPAYGEFAEDERTDNQRQIRDRSVGIGDADLDPLGQESNEERHSG